MDALKGLKYALVLVLVTSAILLGWTTYLERKLHSQQEAFATAVATVKNEQDAKQVIQAFLKDTHVRDVANSADADTSCSWLCDQK